jgi:hypothetical protein
MLDHCRQRARPCRSARLARSGTPHLVAHRAIHSYVPTRTTVLRAKAIASTAAARPPPDQRCGQISIAPAAPSVPYPPRFRALALFRRRPPERVVGIGGAGVGFALRCFAGRALAPLPSLFRRLQICCAVILVECGSLMLPLHRNRLRPECPKEAFPLRINLYPWCSIFWLPCILNPPPWRAGTGRREANSANRERRCG